MQPTRPTASHVGEAVLAAAVQEFEVSPYLAAIQFEEAGLIDQRTLNEWATQSAGALAARYGWLSQHQAMSGTSTQPRAPQTLMRRAVEGYHRGVVSIAELAAWYGQSPEQLLEQLGSPRHVNVTAVAEDLGDLDDDLDEDAPLFPPGFDVSRAPAS